MFIVKAGFSDTIDFKADIERVRAMFSDVKNFAELMPNVERIHIDSKGIARWTIVAKLALMGAMRETFDLRLTEDLADRIEWSPTPDTTNNFLRYSVEFERRNGSTRVIFSQNAELRRNSARDLHSLAGFAGEELISYGMTAEITSMIKTFIKRAKAKLDLE